MSAEDIAIAAVLSRPRRYRDYNTNHPILRAYDVVEVMDEGKSHIPKSSMRNWINTGGSWEHVLGN